MKIYIAGKITGMENIASVLFENAENTLKRFGQTPVNPMKLPHKHNKEWESYMKECIRALIECQQILLLDNWMHSEGARMEATIAFHLKIPIISASKIKIDLQIIKYQNMENQKPKTAPPHIILKIEEIENVVKLYGKPFFALVNQEDVNDYILSDKNIIHPIEHLNEFTATEGIEAGEMMIFYKTEAFNAAVKRQQEKEDLDIIKNKPIIDPAMHQIYKAVPGIKPPLK